MSIAEFAAAKRAEVLRDHERETAYRLGVATMEMAEEQGKVEYDSDIPRTPFVPLRSFKIPVAIRHLGPNFILMIKVNEHNTANYARVRPSGIDDHIEYPVKPEDLIEADQEVVNTFANVAQAMGVDVDAIEAIPDSASAHITDDLDIFP